MEQWKEGMKEGIKKWSVRKEARNVPIPHALQDVEPEGIAPDISGVGVATGNGTFRLDPTMAR
jgi:hypothetical protein